MNALVAQPVKQVFDLVAPELALVFDFSLAAGKIFDHEDSLIGDFGFFDAEFEEFFHGGFTPVEPDELFEFAFGDFCLVGGTVPGEAEHIIPFVYFICKPLLQSCWRA